MKYKMLIILIMFIIPIKIYALEANPIIECDKEEILVNEIVTCNIKVNVTDKFMTSFSGLVNVSNNLELLEINKGGENDYWQGNGDNGDFELYTDTPKNGEVPIGTVKIRAKNKVKSTESIKIINISLGDENFNEVSKSNLEKNILVNVSTNEVVDNIPKTSMNASTIVILFAVVLMFVGIIFVFLNNKKISN